MKETRSDNKQGPEIGSEDEEEEDDDDNDDDEDDDPPVSRRTRGSGQAGRTTSFSTPTKPSRGGSSSRGGSMFTPRSGTLGVASVVIPQIASSSRTPSSVSRSGDRGDTMGAPVTPRRPPATPSFLSPFESDTRNRGSAARESGSTGRSFRNTLPVERETPTRQVFESDPDSSFRRPSTSTTSNSSYVSARGQTHSELTQILVDGGLHVDTARRVAMIKLQKRFERNEMTAEELEAALDMD
jgi:hypothetical protein